MEQHKREEWRARRACRRGFTIVFGTTLLAFALFFAGLISRPPRGISDLSGHIFLSLLVCFAVIIVGVVISASGTAVLPNSPSFRLERIMGGLASIVGATVLVLALGLVSVLSTTKTNTAPGKLLNTNARIAELHSALSMFEAKNEKFPATLQVLVDEKYMSRIKTDGWGQPLDYNPATGEISSRGSGKFGPVSSRDLRYPK